MLRKQAKKLLDRFPAHNYQTLNRVELNKDAVLNNLFYIKQQCPELAIMPVLKANAYGHGLKEIAAILNGADCSFLAVDSYHEAAKIRDITKHPILVLGYIKPENARLLDTKKCSFVIQDTAGLRVLGQIRRPVRLHLELNTGMNRLGLSREELEPYLQTVKKYPNLHLEGVMTHLADADNETDNSFTQHQVTMFDQAVELIRQAGFKPKYIHVAQTAGSTKAKSKYANSLRLGIGLYGINPLKPTDEYFADLSGLKPVMELKSTMIKAIDLKKGDRVSYNGIFTAPAAMKIGVLPLGYYEGLPRELGNKGVVTFKNQQLPIVGRICMNHTMINLGKANINVGDEVTVISSIMAQPNSIASICSQHGLFNYVLVTKVSSSNRRVII